MSNSPAVGDGSSLQTPASSQGRVSRPPGSHVTSECAGHPAMSSHAADSDGEDEDGEEEEEEPQLKYKRVLNSHDPDGLLFRDTASCLTVGDKFLAVGTHGGVVSIHDLDGNQVQSWQAHSATVNALSLDAAGEYVGSASDDGQVSVRALLAPEKTSYRFLRPMKCVALHPNYLHEPARPFVAGGLAGDLVLSERGWFGQKDTLLHSGEGPVYNVQWQGTFIAWACDTGVRIYDTKTQRRITHIARQDDSPRPDLYPCHLCWRDARTLLVGWADTVKVVTVRERSAHEQTLGAPLLYAEISALFSTEAVVCGVAPFRGDLLVLSYEVDTLQPDEDFTQVDQQRRVAADPPSLRVISPAAEEVSADVLSVRGYELYQAHDYRLGVASGPPARSHPPADGPATRDDRWVYILSPKDVLCARPRDWKDRVDWLMERDRYAEVLAVLQAERAQPTGPTMEPGLVTTVGERYLESLVQAGDYDRAATVCGEVLGQNAELWEKWVFEFAQLGHLEAISPYIPTTAAQLSGTIYEMVLAFWLSKDVVRLADTIRAWSPDLYNVPSVVAAIEDRLRQLLPGGGSGAESGPNDPTALVPRASLSDEAALLMDILVDLYTYEQRADKVIEYSLILGKPHIIDAIVSQRWIPQVRHKVVLLLQYDYQRYQEHVAKDGKGNDGVEGSDDAVRTGRLAALSQAPGVQLLVRHYDTVPPATAVRQLQGAHLYLLHVYLHALYTFDARGRAGVSPGATAAGGEPTNALSAYGSPVTASAEPGFNQLAAPFYDLQVELYAEYDYPFLLRFLRGTSGYRLERALRVCQARDLVPEMVYLLGRMGDSHRALQLILHRLHDVPQAIAFAREQNDPELWDELLSYARDQPEFVTGLLEHASSYVDPVKVLQSMVPGLQVPGLKRTVIQILHDLQLQVSLRRGCQIILNTDCVRFSDHLRRAQHLGIGVDRRALCLVCQEPILPTSNVDDLLPSPAASPPRQSSPIIQPSGHGFPPDGPLFAFFCGHTFHDRCLLHANVRQLLTSAIRRGAQAATESTTVPALGLEASRLYHHPLAGTLLPLVDAARTLLDPLESGPSGAGLAQPPPAVPSEFLDVVSRPNTGGIRAPRSARGGSIVGANPGATSFGESGGLLGGSPNDMETKLAQCRALRSFLDAPPQCPICASSSAHPDSASDANFLTASIVTAAVKPEDVGTSDLEDDSAAGRSGDGDGRMGSTTYGASGITQRAAPTPTKVSRSQTDRPTSTASPRSTTAAGGTFGSRSVRRSRTAVAPTQSPDSDSDTDLPPLVQLRL
ncbi:Vacuolar protein sorting-associated protein 41 [Tieghemiomyces parasiticus]|uniref:Vacuolar protein sorting-associated protein 41 n=1 Tax=Tieghemiomyces parasiticus TaxID=78921 RepID=A0A9W8E140_9FUNG|nr:Vacuolar protein sorting-associated protein 41 [Tieghemiomyces parasiticus]